MNEFQFQYNSISKSIKLIIICVLSLFATLFIGLNLPINLRKQLSLFIGVFTMGIPIITFFIFRKKAIDNCVAKLSDESVQFKFTSKIRVINFEDIISYKAYHGRNGSELFLKNKSDNFKISVNNNYCKTETFDAFCDTIINQLDNYKLKNNPSLIHEGSIFTKKGMFYFLIIASSLYLFGFFIETNTLRLAIGIGGGFYFFIMWTKYYTENKRQND